MSTTLATTPKNAVESGLLARRDRFVQIAPAGYGVDRAIQISSRQVFQDPDLMECTPASIIITVSNAIELGLDLAKAGGQAFIVAFNKKRKDENNRDIWVKEAQLIIGYRGWKKLVLESGLVTGIDVQVVYEGEVFEAVFGTEIKVHHIPNPKGVKPIAAYCLAQFSDSHIQPFLCREADIARAKASSKSFERGNGPWKTDEAAMVAKTAVRRFAKYLPETPRIVKANEYDEPEVGENVLTIAANVTRPGGLREALTAKPTAAPKQDVPTPEDVLFAEEVSRGMDELAAQRKK